MSEQPRKGTKAQPALAVAKGVHIADWAGTNGVPRRTAFRWPERARCPQAAQGGGRGFVVIGSEQSPIIPAPHGTQDRTWRCVDSVRARLCLRHT
jgi:hypothetical protein